MLSRFGLKIRMAASYVAVSAAAVLVVEAVVLGYFVPRMAHARHQVKQANARVAEADTQAGRFKSTALADEDAAAATAAATGRGALSDRALLAAAARSGFGRTATDPVPEIVEALAGLDGRVAATTAPQAVPVGSTLPGDAVGTSRRVVSLGDGAAWATSPATTTTPDGHRRPFGIAYVRLAGGLVRPGAHAKGSADATGRTPGTDDMLLPGLIMLIMLLPAGGVFGLLSTRRLIGRIRRLAEGTAAMADGDLHARIPVSGGDEVGRLELAFNRMAERLELAGRAERDAAGAAARRDERNRIARDLHDSVSQDLFSANLLAGGLRRALPAGSHLRRQAESMEQTLERTMREMRAMLLELRPVALEEAGLAAALRDLCQAFEARLGIRITAEIDAPELPPAVELAVLRVVQEALGNAARHAEPERIELRVTEAAGQVMVLISDDGRGFDAAGTARRHGMGMALMRERVTELGGTFEVASAPAEGTTVRVRIPA
ncbi:HAMP domain-containing sensor histidine kinase [Actinomadura nitritigenes]|uniref:Oxygen sensor histidine kinase NreB n=1 Tax=Actinomadura nitritigenes TaxID=134602 RepID=A0ABS3RE05_9ACTN|nr:HAMP domain-containing protein [Actinomadura nitritigenes]MBO2444454.1 HAMP domain-containing protein [Actinomadura nitritigenes]